nr:MAG TPA: hypothetical protein [Caudoviricetes sp.]
MKKAVLISIRPKWCQKIANGEKTIEIRKTRPRLGPPFKCYIYCTQGGVALGMWGKHGKVIGEFVCDTYVTDKTFGHDALFNAAACMSEPDVVAYSAGTSLYGWHISDLKIYDTPKDLNEFWFPPELYCEKERCGSCPCDQVADVNGEYSFDCEWRRPLMRPPQSWCYVAEEA